MIDNTELSSLDHPPTRKTNKSKQVQNALHFTELTCNWCCMVSLFRDSRDVRQYQNALLQFWKSTLVNLQINLITYYLHVWYDTSNHSHLAYKLGLPTFLDSVESVLLPLASADIQVSTYCLCLAFVVTRKKFSLLTCVFFLLPSFSVLYSLFLLVMPLI